jgi:hypothetical protein
MRLHESVSKENGVYEVCLRPLILFIYQQTNQKSFP